MASSGKPKRGKAATGLAARAAAELRGIVGAGDRVLVGLSGGVDSIVLLDVLSRIRTRMRFEVKALHVNHQLSPNAAAWARFCRAVCRARAIACRVVKVEVERGNSIERSARDARRAALRTVAADHIALAHTLDDQAETVLHQLLRGTGVKGLSGMPRARLDCRPTILRPLLGTTREEIERYARDRGLEWIEDESNRDTRYTRNWLRCEILPRIEKRVPGYRQTLARAAKYMGEAAALLDALARIDAEGALDEGRLRVEVLRTLPAARARNLLRFVIGSEGWLMPDADALDEALRQALSARSHATVRVALGGCELRRHAGHLYLLPAQTRARAGAVTWKGEREIVLPDGRGVLTMVRRRGIGLSARRLASAPVTIRARRGGERLQLEAQGPHRTVKNLLQEARIPPWERERLPFIYCGEELACIPGIGFDWRFRASPGEPAIDPAWRPRG